IITIKNDLIDPTGFNLQTVPGKSYKFFQPVFTLEKRQLESLFSVDDPVIYYHMLAVRVEASDIIGEEYVFIRGYRIGRTIDGEVIVIVVEAQVKGGCHLIDEDGHIGGDGHGRWYGVLCPAEALSELTFDLETEEARRRELLPKIYYELPEDD